MTSPPPSPAGDPGAQRPAGVARGRRGVTRWVADASPRAAPAAKMSARGALVIAATPVSALTAPDAEPSTSVTPAGSTSGLTARVALGSANENHPTG
ncbi:hypothetical protein JOD54_001729 [Actinokineospora baliensis]|uniref:hypothetical protein n=1 Tax=Actinokineospora baliensis TaxID=547056 RepID=UPI001956EB27|nr:hypothetical protein [Actinokineospora baliensis]MBM7771525.1 hypothetical protein [Actinokineospora baliensis]